VKITGIEKSALPENWRRTPAPAVLMFLGAERHKKSDTAVLKVPSVVITTEFEYLINLSHPDFKKIKIDLPEDFCYDPHMWKQHEK
jgi:RES domain-containing protein